MGPSALVSAGGAARLDGEEEAVGSLIPSEMWDWRTDWPKAVAGIVVTLLVFAVVAVVAVIG